MRRKLFILLSELHSEHPWKMILLVIVLSAISLVMALNLDQTMRWSDLLPTNDPRTIEFDKVIQEFVSSSSVIVVVQGEEKKIKAFADHVAPQLLSLKDPVDGKPFVQRVDYKKEEDFLREHGLMLIKSDYLENMMDVFRGSDLRSVVENINNSLEKEYVGRGESLSTREKEDRAVSFLDGVSLLLENLTLQVQDNTTREGLVKEAVDRLLIGEPYMLSYDKTALIIDVFPNFNMVEIERLMPGIAAIQGIIDGGMAFFPGVKAGLTGAPSIQHDEMVYTNKSLGYTSIIALISIFLLLALAFRMAFAPGLAILNLVIGVIWAMGVAYLAVGKLNIMTSMTGVVLLGLGIDFSIHIISGFTEERSLGKPIRESLRETFFKCGNGIITGALTTSAAFLTLLVSVTRGMREMGLVMGLGLLSVMVVTFLFLPSLLVLRDRREERKVSEGKKIFRRKDISFRFLGRAAEDFTKRKVVVLVTSLLVTSFLTYRGASISFDHNYMNLEPEGLTSIKLYDTILEKFDFSIDYSMFLAPSLEESFYLAEEAKNLPSVAMVQDISIYLPSTEEQRKRESQVMQIAESIRTEMPTPMKSLQDLELFLEQLFRLQMNLMEIQDMAFLGGQDKVDRKCKEIIGSPDDPASRNRLQEYLDHIEKNRETSLARLSAFEANFSPYFKESVLKMASGGEISMKDLPFSILNRYANQNRDHFLVSVYPKRDIWKDARFLDRFVDDLERISVKATGMPPIFRALMRVMGRDGRRAVLLTLLVVFLILWFDFGKIRYALTAMIPLGAGILWMVGFMDLSGMKLNVVNIMGLPLILGIGIDDGVYVIHRWMQEGRKDLPTVFSSTGKAILLTSLTDMLAFGSLMFSIYKGFASFGGAMFLGVGACFLTTVILIPPILDILGHYSR